MAAFPKASLNTADAAQYINRHSTMHPVLEKLQARTWELCSSYAIMLSEPPTLNLMELLLRATGAKRYLEVGVFTGLSALSAALALPPDGVVVGLDNSQEFADIGKPFFKEAGVDHKIDLRIGDAIQSLDALISEGQSGSFDFAFIDALKDQYDDYYERCLKLVRKGGIIVLDNVLWQGQVYDESIPDSKIYSLRKINEKISKDERVHTCMLTVGDGLTLALVK
uniref:Putative o-methyltransferase n=1 Tax=Amblyomma triste TaxID=251400 RepID=A0A023GGI7_AMBTT